MGCGAGPGFYFALQASKSHEYPPREMQALPPGTHSRSMLLCKVAKGKVFRSERNMDTLTQPPDGFHSVMGVATEEGPLNYDELVVYDEAAILPCAALSVPPVLGGACAALLTFAVPREVCLLLRPIRVGTFRRILSRWPWLPLAASRVACGRRSWVKVTYEFVKLEATEPAAEGDQARPAPSPPKHSVVCVTRPHWQKSLSG